MAIRKEGRKGEKMAHQLLKKLNYPNHLQPDMITKGIKLPNDQFIDDWIILEVKHQEYFKAGYTGDGYCKFDGHGLPPHQIKQRLELKQDKKIPTYLLIFEKNISKNGDSIYIEELEKLNKGQYYQTDKHKRRIFPLDSFQKYNFGWKTLIKDEVK